jgi:hypothetical protein
MESMARDGSHHEAGLKALKKGHLVNEVKIGIWRFNPTFEENEDLMRTAVN